MNLKCFDKIDISDLVIKNHRISVKYTMEYEGTQKTYNLIESYQENINVEGVQEIAALISIIPAINYGLFTKEINIDFPLHKEDFQFFRDMLFITAGDILVNRIIKDTGLIIRKYVEPVDIINSSALSDIATINVKYIYNESEISNNNLSQDKAMILVGGGKDSLLSYGLLNEIGLEVHPVFINEAGRHWFTALTAYRYFSKNIKNTTKVWTNVDRLFASIEKNMKIVVPHYWEKNREIYPIRTFWYAHYILSTLPLTLKRKIGNITLGNEYDDPTGLSFNYKGIRHYYAAYDQSQDFDKYMTEWFHKRGLDIYQWSPIRTLSGLIVEKILYQRYPHLFKLQTSCHSTHIENGVVRPCGVCFKCIGIQIFLLANNIDVKLLRYHDIDEQFFAENLKNGRCRLDKSELEHSLHLINQNINWNLPQAVPHWYVETIRFDPVNSHKDSIPDTTLRNKIFNIFEKYTSGYSELKDNKWERIDKNATQ